MSKSNRSKTAISTAKKLLEGGVSTFGGVARNNLERFGGLLDTVNAKNEKNNTYRAVDLSAYRSGATENEFAKKTLETSKQMFSPRIISYGKMAKKVVPDSFLDKLTDTAFSQVAKLAATWSEIDLPHEHRFSDLDSLNNQERNALAQDIANQNRALATMGSVTGLAGLPGVIADTLWLLMVSLRTVYQLAHVYGKPLTGKQGVQIAYTVLSHADLSKMQQKQAVLSGLGLVKELLEASDNKGLGKEMNKILGLGDSVEVYADKIDKIASQLNFDVDSINLSWLVRFVPLTSVVAGVYYNSRLIDQVIGTTKATFAPDPKLALANSSDKQKDADNKDSDKANDDKVSTDKQDTSEDKGEKGAIDPSANPSSESKETDSTEGSQNKDDDSSTDAHSKSEKADASHEESSNLDNSSADAQIEADKEDPKDDVISDTNNANGSK